MYSAYKQDSTLLETKSLKNSNTMNFGEDESIDNMQKVTKKSHSFKKTNMTGFGNFDNDLNDSEYN